MNCFPGANRFRAWQQRAAQRAFRRELETLTDGHGRPFFVKVGAHDGLTGDPCTEFLLANARWQGLLIEPIPAFAEKLKHRFADRERFTVLQLAVGETEGTAAFYYILKEAERKIPNLPDWYDQLSSFDLRHIEKHLGNEILPFIGTLQVAVKPLRSILHEHNIQAVDLLQVDTEGYDLDVLESLDFSRHKPRVIFVEHKHLAAPKKQVLMQLLADNGYKVSDCGGDFYAKLRRS